jgi:hypothetical protein
MPLSTAAGEDSPGLHRTDSDTFLTCQPGATCPSARTGRRTEVRVPDGPLLDVGDDRGDDSGADDGADEVDRVGVVRVGAVAEAGALGAADVIGAVPVTVGAVPDPPVDDEQATSDSARTRTSSAGRMPGRPLTAPVTLPRRRSA